MSLTPEERATYEWQMWVEDFGEAGQEKLKAASVLVADSMIFMLNLLGYPGPMAPVQHE